MVVTGEFDAGRTVTPQGVRSPDPPLPVVRQGVADEGQVVETTTFGIGLPIAGQGTAFV